MNDEETPNATRDRPVTEDSYGIPDAEAGMLPWSFVTERLAGDRTYWLTTTLPDGRPHPRPVWGVWVDGRLHCGGERTRWVRNVGRDPRVVVHRESGTDVVVLDGVAERVDEGTADPDRLERIDDAYERKYGVRHGTPVFSIRPTRVLAWSDYPTDATRWWFAAGRAE